MATKKIKVIEVNYLQEIIQHTFDYYSGPDVELKLIPQVVNSIEWVEVSEQEYEAIEQAIEIINSESLRLRYVLLSDCISSGE